MVSKGLDHVLAQHGFVDQIDLFENQQQVALERIQAGILSA
jgi:hypothetical protein